jgi:hypothetical protein
MSIVRKREKADGGMSRQNRKSRAHSLDGMSPADMRK